MKKLIVGLLLLSFSFAGYDLGMGYSQTTKTGGLGNIKLEVQNYYGMVKSNAFFADAQTDKVTSFGVGKLFVVNNFKVGVGLEIVKNIRISDEYSRLGAVLPVVDAYGITLLADYPLDNVFSAYVMYGSTLNDISAGISMKN